MAGAEAVPPIEIIPRFLAAIEQNGVDVPYDSVRDLLENYIHGNQCTFINRKRLKPTDFTRHINISLHNVERIRNSLNQAEDLANGVIVNVYGRGGRMLQMTLILRGGGLVLRAGSTILQNFFDGQYQLNQEFTVWLLRARVEDRLVFLPA